MFIHYYPFVLYCYRNISNNICHINNIIAVYCQEYELAEEFRG